MEDVIPKHLQPFFDLKFLSGTEKEHSVVFDALTIAVRAIDNKIRIGNKYVIIIDKSPFQIPVGQSNSLNCTTGNDVICLNFENVILLDYQKLSCRPFECKVAIILEEFVHAVMNVLNESLVKKVVCLLYSDVTWDGEQYAPRRYKH